MQYYFIIHVLTYIYSLLNSCGYWTLNKQYYYSKFNVVNGIKQGRVLSPILFTVYTDGLLKRVENIRIYMESRFTEDISYADDISLLAPCKSA